MDPVTVQAVAKATEAVALMLTLLIESTPQAVRERHAERIIERLEAWDRFWAHLAGAEEPKK